jgi:hypothetical protein
LRLRREVRESFSNELRYATAKVSSGAIPFAPHWTAIKHVSSETPRQDVKCQMSGASATGHLRKDHSSLMCDRPPGFRSFGLAICVVCYFALKTPRV